MRIGYLTARYPFGTGESFLRAELDEMVAQGVEIYIVPLNPSGAVGALPSRVNLLARPILSPTILWGALLSLVRHPRRSLAALWRMRRGRARDVVRNLAVWPKGLWLGRVAQRLDLSHIHAHWATYPATVAMTASAVTGIPWSFTAHRHDIVADNLLDAKLNDASFARFISKSGLQLLSPERLDEHRERIHVIHMGVAIPREVAPQSSSRSILCPASLVPVKGHRVLIEAASILRDKKVECELLLAGDGPERQKIEEDVRRRGVEGVVRLLGQLPHHDIVKMYSRGQIHAVVLPSLDLGAGEHEGIPVALMEAMAHGIPVVSTQTGGVPELVQDAGLLVAQDDAEALAIALLSLLTDQSLHARLGDAGRSRVEREFSAAGSVQALRQAISESRSDP